jgi:hypothetical protein
MPVHLHTQDAGVARAEDRDRVAAVIALAFSTDPVCRWMYPDRTAMRVPDVRAAMGGRAFDHDAAYCTPDLPAPRLLPPGVGPTRRRWVRTRPHGRPREARGVQAVWSRWSTIPRPHWYLPLIGVDPARQRSGQGRRSCAAPRARRSGWPPPTSSREPAERPNLPARCPRSSRLSRSATCHRSFRWCAARQTSA